MATMESLQKVIEDMNTMMTKMNSTLETLVPLAPSAADLGRRLQIAAMNGVTECAFPVGRDTELGFWWAKKAAD